MNKYLTILLALLKTSGSWSSVINSEEHEKREAKIDRFIRGPQHTARLSPAQLDILNCIPLSARQQGSIQLPSIGYTENVQTYLEKLSLDVQLLLRNPVKFQESYYLARNLHLAFKEEPFPKAYDDFYTCLLKEFTSEEKVSAFRVAYEDFSHSETKRKYFQNLDEREKKDLHVLESILKSVLYFRLYCFFDSRLSFTKEATLKNYLETAIFLERTAQWLTLEIEDDLEWQDQKMRLKDPYLASCYILWQKFFPFVTTNVKFSNKNLSICSSICTSITRGLTYWLKATEESALSLDVNQCAQLLIMEIEKKRQLLSDHKRIRGRILKLREKLPIIKKKASPQESSKSSVQTKAENNKETSKAARRRAAKLRKKEAVQREKALFQEENQPSSLEAVSLLSLVTSEPASILPKVSFPLVPVSFNSTLVVSDEIPPYKKEKIKTRKPANPEDSTKPWYRKVTQLPKIKVPSSLNPFKRVMPSLTRQYRTTLESIFSPKKVAQKVTREQAFNLLSRYGETIIKNVTGSHVQVDTTINGVSSHLTWSSTSGYLKPAALKDLKTLLEDNGITPDDSSSGEETETSEDDTNS